MGSISLSNGTSNLLESKISLQKTSAISTRTVSISTLSRSTSMDLPGSFTSEKRLNQRRIFMSPVLKKGK